MGQIKIVSPAEDDLLNAFLAGCAGATVYHTPQWRDAVVATYGYEPMYLAYTGGTGIEAILPLMLVKSWLTGRRLVSLPFSNVCGPVGSRDGVAALVERAVELRLELGAKALEIRTQAGLNTIDDARFIKLTYYITYIVKMDSNPATLWESFKDRSVRKEVRQAAKKGIEVRDAEGPEDLSRFYELFSNLRLKHGVPPQPYAFFRNLWDHLWPEHLHLHVATFEGRHVASLMMLGFGTALYAGYIGSDPAYRSHRVHQMLLWKAMERGCLKGYKTFDFLRTPRNAQTLRYFKERWNAYEMDLEYLYHPRVAGTVSTIEETAKYRVMTATLKRAPKSVGKALGRAIFRHLG
jgi:CelD/BcsL family acetyltransferase involved in cellulose biosynthesis